MPTKVEVEKYIEEHKIGEKVQAALNTVIAEQSADPLAAICRELMKMKEPAENGLEAAAAAPAAEDAGPIIASSKFDPGLQDIFDAHAKELAANGAEEMENLKLVPNDPSGAYPVVSTFSDHPAVDELMVINPSYGLADRKRSFCLVVEDMQVRNTLCALRTAPLDSSAVLVNACCV